MPKSGSIRFRKMRSIYSSANYTLGFRSIGDEEDIDEDEDEGQATSNGKARLRKGNTRRRGNLPPEAVEMMTKWLIEHADYAYPTEEEKKNFCVATGLTLLQVNNWFINARRRILRRYLKERGLDHTLYTHSRSGKKQAAAAASHSAASMPPHMSTGNCHASSAIQKKTSSPQQMMENHISKKSDLRSWMEHNYNGARRLLETSSESDSETESEMDSTTTTNSATEEEEEVEEEVGNCDDDEREFDDDQDDSFSCISPPLPSMQSRHRHVSWSMSPPSTDTDASDDSPHHRGHYWDYHKKSRPNFKCLSSSTTNPASMEPTPPPSPPHQQQRALQIYYQLDDVCGPNNEMRALLCVVEAEHRSMMAAGDGFLNKPITWL